MINKVKRVPLPTSVQTKVVSNAKIYCHGRIIESYISDESVNEFDNARDYFKRKKEMANCLNNKK